MTTPIIKTRSAWPRRALRALADRPEIGWTAAVAVSLIAVALNAWGG